MLERNVEKIESNINDSCNGKYNRVSYECQKCPKEKKTDCYMKIKKGEENVQKN